MPGPDQSNMLRLLALCNSAVQALSLYSLSTCNSNMCALTAVAALSLVILYACALRRRDATSTSVCCPHTNFKEVTHTDKTKYICAVLWTCCWRFNFVYTSTHFLFTHDRSVALALWSTSMLPFNSLCKLPQL